MTCPPPICTVTPRPPAPPIPTPLAPPLAVSPLASTITKITSCDGCMDVPTPRANPIRQPARTITIGQDPCAVAPTPPQVIYEATKTVTLSQPFNKNNCATGAGSAVTYTTSADATVYSVASQADADARAQLMALTAAQQDIATNGQANANAIGVCV